MLEQHTQKKNPSEKVYDKIMWAIRTAVARTLGLVDRLVRALDID